MELFKGRISNKRKWSEILPEIIENIDDTLPPHHRLRLRWICPSWRSIATTKQRRDLHHQPSTHQPPLLALRRTADTLPSFYSLSRNTFIDLALPAAFRDTRCCGCLDGWLLTVSDQALHLTLIHPVTRARLPLPSRPQSFLGSKHQSPPRCRVTKAVLSAPPTSTNSVVAAMAGYNIILLCRPGDAEWALFECGLESPLEDIMFYNGQLCALDAAGKLTVITLDKWLRGSASLSVRPAQEMEAPTLYSRRVRHRYLVESAGDLLVVVKQYDSPVMTFTVFKLESSGSGKWTRVQDLGERALFVGAIRSESVSAMEMMGVRGNCIYFISRIPEMIAPDGVGMYSLKDNKVEPISLASGCSLVVEPVWVKPSII